MADYDTNKESSYHMYWVVVDVQCQKTCMWMVLKGEKTSLNLIRNSYKKL